MNTGMQDAWNLGWKLALVTQGRVDEKLLASPMFIGTQMFFYRTDIFEKAGIAAPPTTYAELADVCKKVHGDDVSAIALRSAPSTSQMIAKSRVGMFIR